MENSPTDGRNSPHRKHASPLVLKSAPLTYMQEWALKDIVHEEDPYIFPLFVRLRGVLHVDVLRKSLDSVMQRHDALRTRIVAINGELKQQINEPAECHLDLVKFSGGLESGTE